MPRKKHLIVIHGRATKPSSNEKERLVKKSLLHGLERVDSAAAGKVKNGTVKFNFVYYGDINNREMINHDPDIARKLTGTNTAKYGGGPCEPAESYDDDLKRMFQQKVFTKKAYDKLLDEERDRRGFDEAASIISGLASLVGLNDNVIRRVTPDLGAYLMRRKVGSQIRARLQGPLKKALLAGDDVCLVAHSMGCIVSYDVLWKFSQMSEYRDIQNSKSKVSLWLTLGNPLGETGVIENLYDSNEYENGKYPKHIIDTWTNISARDDYVAHDERIANDYSTVKQLGYVRQIRDIVNIHNFWVGSDGSNPHKFYGYLDNPKVAGEIAKWIKKK
jgi:hypothetical protein